MAARGPVPTPSAVLKMRGSWREKTRTGEPSPDRGKPTVPAALTAPQKLIWKRLTSELDAMGVLTVADGWQLERYCVYLERWRVCERFLAEKGTTYTLLSDKPVAYLGQLPGDGAYVVGFRQYPQVKQSLDLHKALKEIEDRFGLTPAARARLTAPGEDEDQGDEFDQWQKQA